MYQGSEKLKLGNLFSGNGLLNSWSVYLCPSLVFEFISVCDHWSKTLWQRQFLSDRDSARDLQEHIALCCCQELA